MLLAGLIVVALIDIIVFGHEIDLQMEGAHCGN